MIKIIFVIFIAALLFLVDYLRKRNQSRKKYWLPEQIKRRYKKVSAHTGNIEILANEYFEEDSEGGNYAVSMVDALYDPNLNYSKVNKFASVIVYYHTVMGKKYRLRSETIDISPGEIEKKLQANAIIDVYYNEKNPGNHYFDLSFLAD